MSDATERGKLWDSYRGLIGIHMIDREWSFQDIDRETQNVISIELRLTGQHIWDMQKGLNVPITRRMFEGLRLLVVDDDPNIRDLEKPEMRRLFSAACFQWRMHYRLDRRREDVPMEFSHWLDRRRFEMQLNEYQFRDALIERTSIKPEDYAEIKPEYFAEVVGGFRVPDYGASRAISEAIDRNKPLILPFDDNRIYYLGDGDRKDLSNAWHKAEVLAVRAKEPPQEPAVPMTALKDKSGTLFVMIDDGIRRLKADLRSTLIDPKTGTVPAQPRLNELLRGTDMRLPAQTYTNLLGEKASRLESCSSVKLDEYRRTLIQVRLALELPGESEEFDRAFIALRNKILQISRDYATVRRDAEGAVLQVG